MSKKSKFNFRTHVWPKYVISLAVLAVSTGAILGGVYAYSKNSNEKLGRENPTDSALFKNVFVKDATEAKGAFLSADKTQKLATYDLNNDKVVVNGEEKDVRDYLNDFYKENHFLPVLNIQYGSFNFFNDYIEAVSPSDFFKFTSWFMKNVSWGPEIITLKSFSIVKGVELKGNSITLGAHANLNKEYTTITFYPDAFFGSLPIFSSLSGAGNGSDSLVYKLNKNLLTSDQMKDFLSKIAQYNALANTSSKALSFYAFRNINDIRQLEGQKVYVLKQENWKDKLKKIAINDIEKGRLNLTNPYLLLINGKDLEDAKKNLQKEIDQYKDTDKYEMLKNIDVNNLEEKTITHATINPNEAIDKSTIHDRYLQLFFEDGSEYKLFKSLKDVEYEIKTNTSSIFSIENEELVEPIAIGFENAKNRLLDLMQNFEETLKKIATKYNIDENDFNLGSKAQNLYLDLVANNSEFDKKIAELKEQLDQATDESQKDQIKAKIAEQKTKKNELLENAKQDVENYFAVAKNSDVQKFDNLVTLLTDFHSFLNEDLVKNINAEINPTETQNKLELEKELADNYNVLYSKYNNELQTIASPIIDGVSFTSEKYKPHIYYTEDLGYLPNQLIAVSALKTISEQTWLNWRDFYNLNGFLDSNRLESNLNPDINRFYIYAKKLNSLEEEFNTKHPNSTFKLEFSKLQKQLKDIRDESNELYDKKVAIESLATVYTVDKNNPKQSVKELLSPYVSEKSNLPEQYKMFGFNGENAPFKNIDDFNNFAGDSFEILEEYINLLYNGNPDAIDSHDKEGFLAYYNRVAQPALTKHQQAFEELKEIRIKRDKASEEIRTSDAAPTTDQKVALANYVALYFQKEDEFNKLTEVDGEPTFSQLYKLESMKKDLDLAKSKSAEYAGKKEEYINLSVKLFSASLDSRFVDFKLKFLLNSPSFTDEALLNKYQQVIDAYENDRATLETKYRPVAEQRLLKFQIRSNATLAKIKNQKYETAFSSEKTVDSYQTEETLAQDDLNSKQEEYDNLKAKFNSDVEAMSKIYDDNEFEANVKLSQKAEEFKNVELAKIDEFINNFDSYKTKNEEGQQSTIQEIIDLKTKYDSEKDEQEKLKTSGDIGQKVNELNILRINLDSNKDFANFLSTQLKTSLDDLTSNIADSSRSWEDLLILNKAFKSAFDKYIEALVSNNQKPSEEINTFIEEFTQLIDENSQALSDKLANVSEYSLLKGKYSFDRIDLLNAKDKLDKVQENLNSIKKNKKDLETINANQELAKAHEEVITANKRYLDAFDAERPLILANTIIAPGEPKDANSAHKVDNYRFELNQLISNFNNSDKIIKKVNDYLTEFNNPDGPLSTAKTAYEEKVAELSIDKLQQESNEALQTMSESKLLENYQEALKNESLYKALKNIHNEDPNYFQTLVNNLQMEIDDEDLKEAIISVADNNLDDLLEKLINQTSQKKQELLAKMQEILDINKQLEAANKQLEDQKNAYTSELEKLYKKIVLHSYDLIDKDQLKFNTFHDLVASIDVNVSEINSKIFAVDARIKKINDLKKQFANLEEELDKLTNEVNLKNTKQQIEDFFTDEYAVQNKSLNLLSVAFMNIIPAVEGIKESLETKYNAIESRQEEIRDENSDYEEDSEYIALEEQKEAIEEEYGSYQIDELETISSSLEDGATAIDNDLKVEQSDASDPKIDAYNEKIDAYLINSVDQTKAFKVLNDYLDNFEEYVNLLQEQNNSDSKLIKLYNKSIKNSLDAILTIRKDELLRKNKQVELYNPENIGVELENENQLIVASTKVELIDILTKKGILKADATNEEIDNVIHKVELTDISKSGTKLIITLNGIRKSNEAGFDGDYSQYYYRFNVDANIEDGRLNTINKLFKTVGYKKIVKPSLLKEEGPILNRQTNKTEKGYSIFAEAYDDLLRQLIKEVPYAAEYLDGEHVVSKLNEKGEMVYSVESGPYLGFSRDTRIGLWAILRMSDPNFKGISSDFLKFVSAHEYGHHFTLNAMSDLGDKADESIFISALLPGAAPTINNYYNRKTLDLYLKARSNLELNSDRLLKDGNVEKDYGEYPVFVFPYVENGKLKYREEKEANIWGTDLSEDDIIKALNNKKRRFLQDYDGFKEAVEERKKDAGLTGEFANKLSLHDLWMINALDQYSGTINPTVNGIAKYLVKQQDGSYLFTPGSLKILDGILKDGSGNLIHFYEENGEVLPKVVEGVKDANGDYISISEVLIKDANGNGIINLPLNETLTDTKAIKYVNEKINQVSDTIKKLIVTNYNINGWNTVSSDLSVNPKLVMDWPILGELWGKDNGGDKYYQRAINAYKDMILARDPENGSVFANRFSHPTYYDKKGNISVEKTNQIRTAIPNHYTSNIYINPNMFRDDGFTTSFEKSMYAMSKTGSRAGFAINESNGMIFFIDKAHQYITNVKNEKAFDETIAPGSWGQDTKDYIGVTKVLKSMNEVQKEFIGIQNDSLWKAYDINGKLLTKDGNVTGNYPVWADIASIKINTSAIFPTFENDLFNLYGNDANGRGSLMTFDNMQQFSEFSSVDLKQATLDKSGQMSVVNWNVDYAKTKVSDFEAFKKALKLATNTNAALSQEEKDKYLTIANSDDDQVVANEIMERFQNSKLALFTSHLTIQDMKDHPEYAWIFDQKYGYGDYKVTGLNLVEPDKAKWEIPLNVYLDSYNDLAERLTYTDTSGTKYKPTDAQFSIFDSLIFNGKVQAYTEQNTLNFLTQEYGFADIYLSIMNGKFKLARPSDDVITYYGSKNERKFNEKFSDYTFNWAEIINRDNLQITYSPSTNDFGNLPAFLSNISESSTGLEYVVDGTPTQQWADSIIDFDGSGRDNLKNAVNEYEANLNQEAKDRARSLGVKYQPSVFADSNNFNDGYTYRNNYFGKFQSINNGWLKDRWYREITDFTLYDDHGMPVQDENIRITDLKGKKVTNRPQAFWEFYIQSQGVGKRNLSTIWRDTDKDAVAMFGYLPNDAIEKTVGMDKDIYLAFQDLASGEVKTQKLILKNTNHMFYYKSQNPNNEDHDDQRHYLKDEEYDYSDLNGEHKGKGFTAWVTDFIVMSRYRNKFLIPNHKYYVYFASDVKGKDKILELDLGNVESVSENGKTYSQAPFTVHKADASEENGKYKGKAIAVVKDQFNGVV